MAICKTCRGKGSVKCPKCNGKGERYESTGFLSGKNKECSLCHGSGVKECGACGGTGRT